MWSLKRHPEIAKTTVYEGFPEHLKEDVGVVLRILDVSQHDPQRGLKDMILASGERIRIPLRVYFPKNRAAKVDSLTQQQLAIFAALLTRHYDGYQRETWARVLCRYPTVWTAPYLVELLGGYVIQVLEVLEEGVGIEWQPIIQDFVVQNELDTGPFSHRILNYWNLYYRWYPPHIRRLAEYPGFTVSSRLGLWNQSVGKRLLKKKS